MRIAVVVSEYHGFITEGLEAGARAALAEAGLLDDVVETFRVPGAYELAQAALRVAESGEYAAVICLGCLIKGETPHFDYIAQAASHGIMHAAQATGVPIAFGVLTVEDREQAQARVGGAEGHKGEEAAATAIEMVSLLRNLPS